MQSASTSQFLLANALDEAGLSLDDVTLLDMSSGDAGAAFVAGQVDAAVTWQPWLANARETDFGHLLLDTTETPGLIVDTVAFRPQFIAENPEAVAGIRPRLLPRGRGDRGEPRRGKCDHGREHWHGDGGLRRHAR